MVNRSAIWVVLGVVSSCAAHAHASATFPDVVRATWGVRDLGVPGNGCLLCHTTEDGAANTVRQPFGRTVKDDYGVPGMNNVGALKGALQQMRARGTDSDRDGITDYDELANGTNVNVKDSVEPPGAPTNGGAGGDDANGGSSGEDSDAGGSANGGDDLTPPELPSEPELPMPQTGCGVSSRSEERGWLALTTLALAWSFVRRRRAHSAGRARER